MKFQVMTYSVSYAYTGKNGEIIREEHNFGENKIAADRYKEKVLKDTKALYITVTITEIVEIIEEEEKPSEEE